MATYLQGVSDTNTPTPFLSLDYNFLQQQESKANMQYQQGLDEVHSDYSAVVNAAVTGPMAQKVKEQYLQDAQQKLKKISASDLFLPQNVQQAEAVFAPFWKDDMLVSNIGLTKSHSTMESQYFGDLNSKDKDIRAAANPLMLEAIQLSKKQLGDLPWEQGSYSSFRSEMPTYTRFEDLNSKAAAEFEKLKLKGVTTVGVNGETLVQTTNGPMSKEAYTTFWLGMNGGPEHDQQFRVSAYVDHRRKIEGFKGMGLDEVQARQMAGSDYLRQYNNTYKDKLATYTKMAKDAGDGYKNLKLADPANITVQEDATIQSYKRQEQAYLSTINDIESKYSRDLGYVKNNLEGAAPGSGKVDENSEAYHKMMNTMTTRPLDYLSDILKYKQGNNWGAAIASISSTDLKENPAFKTFQENQIKMMGIKNAADRNAINAEHYSNEDYDRAYRISPEYAKSIYGEEAATAHDQWLSAGGHRNSDVIDLSTGDVHREDPTLLTKEPVALDALQERMNTLHSQLVGNTYSTDGLTGQLLTKTVLGSDNGLDANQIALLNRWGLSHSQPTTEEAAAIDKVKTALKTYGIDSKITGPETLMPALQLLGSKMVDKALATSDPEAARKIAQLHATNNTLMTALDTYNASSANFDKAVQSEILSNSKYKPLVNPYTHKQWTIEEMSHDFPKLTIRTDEGEKELSAKESAQLYRNGQFEIVELNPARPRIKINGKEAVVTGVNGKVIKQGWMVRDEDANMGNDFERYFTGGPGRGLVRVLPGSIIDKYGKSEKLPILQREAGKKVAESMKGYDNGIIASSISYDLTDTDNKSQQRTGIALAKESGFAGNQDAIYTRNGDNTTSSPMDSETVSKINSLLTGSKVISNIFSSIEYQEKGPNGKPAVKLVYQPDANGKKEVDGTKLSALAANSTIYIDVKPNATGALLSHIPHSPDLFINGSLLTDNKTMTSDNFENSVGFKYTITPGAKGSDNRNSDVTVGITINKVDPITGQFVRDAQGNILTEDQHIRTINLMRGDGAMTPDELKSTINKMCQSYLVNIATLKKNYAISNQGTQGTGKSYAQAVNEPLK